MTVFKVIPNDPTPANVRSARRLERYMNSQAFVDAVWAEVFAALGGSTEARGVLSGAAIGVWVDDVLAREDAKLLRAFRDWGREE